jgi:hypothetical protein
MPFCPTCRTEYRILTESCEICNARLVDSLPEEEIRDDDAGIELVELAEFSNVSEAEMVREILEENNIRTVQRGETDPIGIASGAEPVGLLVEERQLARARELYEAFFSGIEVPELSAEE